MTAIKKKYIYRESTIEQRKGAGLLCGWGRKEGGKEGWGRGDKAHLGEKMFDSCFVLIL